MKNDISTKKFYEHIYNDKGEKFLIGEHVLFQVMEGARVSKPVPYNGFIKAIKHERGQPLAWIDSITPKLSGRWMFGENLRKV